MRRRLCAWSEVGPHDAAALVCRIRHGLDFGFEVGLRRLVRHVDAVAVDVELPAVVDAAQAGFFIAAEEQRRAPMRAVALDQAGLAVGVAEADQLLAEQHYPQRIGVRFG